MYRVCILACLLVFSARAALGAEILVHGDTKSSPESMSVGPDGSLYVGNGNAPYVYRIKKGATAAEVFVDASGEAPSAYFFGQLVDGNTLWTCQLTTIAGTGPATTRRSSLRGFDLATGREKLRWNLPGDDAECNDFSIGPDKALYIADTANAKIWRLAAGAKIPQTFIEGKQLTTIDGITFLDGVLYINDVVINKLYRIPIDAGGKPGRPEDIWMDAPARGLDGMRAANGKLFVAANGMEVPGAGKILELTVTGDTAHVTVLKDGLNFPTGVQPAGDTLWFTERDAGKLWSIPLPK